MTQFTETEYKYRINNLSIEDFRRTIETLFKNYDFTFSYISSIDHYYYNGDYPDLFIRNRMPDNDNKSSYELTLKQQNGPNIITRTEINIPLDQQFTESTSVSEFLKRIDFLFQFSLHKKCWIYFFQDFEIVMYDISNDRLNYQRFIEIEAKLGFDSLNNNIKQTLNTFLTTININPDSYVNFSQFNNFYKT